MPLLESLITLPTAAYMLASATICAPHGTPVLDFSSIEKPVILHHDQSTRMLGSEPTSSNGFSHAEFPITGGLTRGRMDAHYEMSFTYREEAPGQLCLWTDKVTMRVTYTPNVYIASDYPVGRCRYQDTYAHEMRHVQMDRDTLKEYLPRIHKAAEEAMLATATSGPFARNGVDARRTMVSAQFKKRIDKIMGQMNADRKIRQQTIDTRAEYLRASHACAR